MSEQLFAVAVSEDGTLAGHAGRAKYWQVYTLDEGELVWLWDINLTSVGSLHEWHVRDEKGSRHPLHGVNVAFARSAGEGVINNLAARNTLLITTDETDPMFAIERYLAGTLTHANDHEEDACGHEQAIAATA